MTDTLEIAEPFDLVVCKDVLPYIPQEMDVEVTDEKLMFRLIRASFNQRRKTLVNGLKNASDLTYTKEQIEAAIEAIGQPLTIRGEALSLSQFAQLTNQLKNMK